MSSDDENPRVRWRPCPTDELEAPIVRAVPYVELRLEHLGLEPTGGIDRFFPDAVPYACGDEARVFFWRPTLADPNPEPADWVAACATPFGLYGLDSVPAPAPPLAEEGGAGVTVVVEGTFAGEASLARLRSYRPPTVRIEDASADALVLSADGSRHALASGTRRRIELPSRDAVNVESGKSLPVSPEVVVRYPGGRQLYHPAVGTTDRLFPSFGLDLDRVPNPLAVPTHNGELDHGTLADELGVDAASRPYAERVLWQAFAYSAFDPHRESPPEVGQCPDGHLVLRDEGPA